MKNRTSLLACLFEGITTLGTVTLGVICIGFASLAIGCKSVNPVTGVREYDPVKTQQVEAALNPLFSAGLGVLLKEKPETADYLRSVGNVFVAMDKNGDFTPDYLIAEANKATAQLQEKADPLVLIAKDTVLALYTIFWSQKARAELPESEWPRHLARVFSNGINTALINAGQPGVK